MNYERVLVTCHKCQKRWWVHPSHDTPWYLCLNCLACVVCGKLARWTGLNITPGWALRADLQVVWCPEHTK